VEFIQLLKDMFLNPIRFITFKHLVALHNKNFVYKFPNSSKLLGVQALPKFFFKKKFKRIKLDELKTCIKLDERKTYIGLKVSERFIFKTNLIIFESGFFSKIYQSIM